jgi:selenide, water dikinase
MMEANCTVIGGHSIREDELKFGYSVTGVVHPDKVLANSGAKAGDALILTKALGTGVISTAIKKEKAKPAWIETAVKSMTTLNKTAAEIITLDGQRSVAGPAEPASPFSVHGLTDVTGFGLIGHARELALASNVSLQIFADRVPFLPGALECARAGYIPGGLKANREFAECAVEYQHDISEETKTLLFDPQTAGGLLISVAGGDAQALVEELENAGVPAAHVGNVTDKAPHLITVL